MATIEQKIHAEQTVRQMLADNGMPPPDEVEYGHGCIRLLFEEPKIALVVDIDDPGEDYGAGGHEPDERSVDAELN